MAIPGWIIKIVAFILIIQTHWFLLADQIKIKSFWLDKTFVIWSIFSWLDWIMSFFYFDLNHRISWYSLAYVKFFQFFPSYVKFILCRRLCSGLVWPRSRWILRWRNPWWKKRLGALKFCWEVRGRNIDRVLPVRLPRNWRWRWLRVHFNCSRSWFYQLWRGLRG